MKDDPIPTAPETDEALQRDRDLGFGGVVARELRTRLLNRDGSFNVRRTGLGFWRSLSLYHWLLAMAWVRFFVLVAAVYVATNALFGTAYFLAGPDALSGVHSSGAARWLDSFFFSVHTVATIGYGVISPNSFLANALVAFEALIGLLGLALVTGILFARFSRPTARMLFSERAVIAPYQGGTALMFRIANSRSSQLIEVEARIVVGMFAQVDGHATRRFSPAALERTRISFMPLTWTVVHPIVPGSPLYGLTEADLRERGAEFMVLLTAIDETFSQTVHVRTSYRYDEIVWGARFSDIFQRDAEAHDLTVDISRLHRIEAAPLPTMEQAAAD
jgi:inward rectifier potassium channel